MSKLKIFTCKLTIDIFKLKVDTFQFNVLTCRLKASACKLHIGMWLCVKVILVSYTWSSVISRRPRWAFVDQASYHPNDVFILCRPNVSRPNGILPKEAEPLRMSIYFACLNSLGLATKRSIFNFPWRRLKGGQDKQSADRSDLRQQSWNVSLTISVADVALNVASVNSPLS